MKRPTYLTTATKAAVAVTAVAALGVLSACSGEDDSMSAPTFARQDDSTTAGTQTPTADPTPTSGADPDSDESKPEGRDVDVSNYTTGTAVTWSLEGDGVECMINTSEGSDYMDCTLDFTEDVRDTSTDAAAGSVLWTDDEGFQPKMQTGGGDDVGDHNTLKKGDRITAAGMTCAATDDRAMTCVRDGESFTYDDGDFDSSTWDGVGERDIRSGSGEPGDDCGKANNGLYADMTNTTVTVAEGRVDCAEAVKTMDTYLSTWQDGSRGNTMVTRLDNGWTCSFPSAARAQERNMAVSCSQEDGRAIKIGGQG